MNLQSGVTPIARSCGRRSQLPARMPVNSQSDASQNAEPIPPFSDLVEQPCEDCGGSGLDSGSLSEPIAERCPSCLGTGQEVVLRNFLAEAFRIVADPESELVLCREHMVALATFARQTVSAMFGAESHRLTGRTSESQGMQPW